MKVCIIGASGLVGSHCMKFFKNQGWNVIGTHLKFPTIDTTYYNPIEGSENDFDLAAFKPDVIIHCGALTNVDYCENNEAESESATVLSTQKLCEFCVDNHAKLVYISTDYVFDGRNGPYTEEDKTNPINIYGLHKLKAEELVKGTGDYLVTRITNVYGEEIRSKNFIARLVSMLQNNEQKDLQLPFDQFATPIYAGDIAKMLFKLLTDNKSGVYHLSSTDYYNRFALAERVKTYFPLNNTITFKSTLTSHLNQPARRPLYGGLLNRKFINEYNDFKFTNVDDFVRRIIKL